MNQNYLQQLAANTAMQNQKQKQQPGSFWGWLSSLIMGQAQPQQATQTGRAGGYITPGSVRNRQLDEAFK